MLSTFVLQFPHLFERLPYLHVVMWSAANIMVQPKAGQAKALKSHWLTILPIIVQLLNAQSAWLQVDSLLMEKEEKTDVKQQLELSVEQIQKASSCCQDSANWPNHSAESIMPTCSMQFKKFQPV